MTRPVLLVCATAFLYMLGLSVLFPVLPRFVQELGIGDAGAGVLLSSYTFGAFLSGSFWGRASDRVGRKPILLVGLGGFTLAFLFFALGRSFEELVAARLFGGLIAGALMPAVGAYIGDVTGRGPERAAAMGAFGAALGLGILFGVVIGGFLGELGPRVPFFSSAGIGAVALVAVALALPESAKPVTSQLADRFSLSEIGIGLGSFLAYSFLLQTGRSAIEAVIGLFARDRFAAGPRDVGLLLGLFTLFGVLVQGGAIRPLSQRFSDRSLLISGTVVLAAGLAVMGLVHSWGALWFVGALCGAAAGLVEPTFRAELSRAGEDFQGDAQGLNSSAQSAARVTAFLIFPVLFSATPAEVTFATAAVLAGLAALVARVGLRAPAALRATPSEQAR